jgi:hypothetical protein
MMKNVITLGYCAGLFAMSASAAKISFQEGNLIEDGAVVNPAYQTQATFVRSGAPDTTNDQNTGLYAGTTSETDFRRLLVGFDLSYLKEKTAGKKYFLRDVELKLTYMVDGKGAAQSTFDLHKTAPFDEKTATWGNPGEGHEAGGLVGNKMASAGLDMAAAAGTVISFDGKPLQDAMKEALESDSGMLYLMLKRRAEGNPGTYYIQPQNDESTVLGVEARPALVVDILIQP